MGDLVVRPLTTAEHGRAARLGFICGWRRGLPARCQEPPAVALGHVAGAHPADNEVGSSSLWTELCAEHGQVAKEARRG